MNYWLHRISHHAELSYPLLEKEYLTIGFSDFIDTEMINCASKDDWNYFDEQFQKKWGEIPRARHSLWRFLRFKKGDTVIVPSWDGTFFVCEVIDDKPLLISDAYSEDLRTWEGKSVKSNGTYLISENGEEFDLGFARKVEVRHKGISRAKFADAKLTARMKIRQTNAAIDDLEESIRRSIDAYEKNRPIHLHSIIVEKMAPTILDSIRSELNPDKFEKLVQIYFKAAGANEVTIPAKNEKGKEGDADIVAVIENIKLIIYIQAKFHEGTTSELGATQIFDYKTHKESIDIGYNKIAWVITTADAFEETAVKIATENEIQLINGLEFSKMLLNVGINLLNTDL